VPKLIGVDYGAKRVGVAISDERGVIAFPKATLPNDRALIPAMVDLIRKENVMTVVVGESRGGGGNENPVMQGARAFAEELEKSAAVAIQFEPEFYTSVEARRLSQEAGGTKKKEVDAQAAAIILNSYIARIKEQ